MEEQVEALRPEIMKAFVRETPGYRDETIENVWECMRIRDLTSDELLPPSGMCFASGDNALWRAQSYATEHLAFGAITLHAEKMTDGMWLGFHEMITKKCMYSQDVAYILHRLDRASVESQNLLTQTFRHWRLPFPWLVTAENPMHLVPELQRQFVVYRGLTAEKQMLFLVDERNVLLADED